MKSNFMNYGVMGAMLLGTSAFAADGVKVGGYVDSQYGWAKLKQDDTSLPTANSFFVNEAALDANASMGSATAKVLLPFNLMDSASTTNGQGVTFDGTNAEAYVGYKFDNGLSWKLGQFGSLYGFEGKDAPDHRFNQRNGVEGLLPTTHVGLTGNYAFSDALGLDVLVANPAGEAEMPAGAGNPDLGFRLSSKMDAFHASVGGLFGHAGGNSNWAFDVIAGTKAGAIDADVEFVMKKDSVWGALVQAGFNMSDSTNIAAQFGYTVPVKDAKVLDFKIGPKFAMNSAFSVRAELGYQNFDYSKTTVATKFNSFGLGVSGLYAF